MTFILSTGLFQRTGVVERTVVAFLGMNYMDIPNPVVIGNTVTAEFEVTEKRNLESQDNRGLVVIDSNITNQDEETVFAGDMKFLFKKRNFDSS